MNPIDLHTHTTKSDGTFSPEDLVRYARVKGLSAVALTDHDTADGIAEAVAAAEQMRREAALCGREDLIPEVIPGVELSTEYNGSDIHIVGLFIDWKGPHFNDQLKKFADARIYRNRRMCDLLTQAGYPASYDEITAMNPDTVIARPHIARYLLEKGYVSSVKEAFNRLIGDDCPCFVPREKISPRDAVRFLLRFDAVPILAHPLQYKMSQPELESLLQSLCEEGLEGIEVYYSGYGPNDTAQLSRLAEQYGLLVSGGSDFHGSRKKNLDLGTGYGRLYVPYSVLPPIRAAHEEQIKKAVDL